MSRVYVQPKEQTQHTMHYDCIYWWQGGTEAGVWKQAVPGDGDVRKMRAEIQRMGYYVVLGSTKIGPPEGPPQVTP